MSAKLVQLLKGFIIKLNVFIFQSILISSVVAPLALRLVKPNVVLLSVFVLSAGCITTSAVLNSKPEHAAKTVEFSDGEAMQVAEDENNEAQRDLIDDTSKSAQKMGCGYVEYKLTEKKGSRKWVRLTLHRSSGDSVLPLASCVFPKSVRKMKRREKRIRRHIQKTQKGTVYAWHKRDRVVAQARQWTRRKAGRKRLRDMIFRHYSKVFVLPQTE